MLKREALVKRFEKKIIKLFQVTIFFTKQLTASIQVYNKARRGSTEERVESKSRSQSPSSSRNSRPSSRGEQRRSSSKTGKW